MSLTGINNTPMPNTVHAPVPLQTQPVPIANVTALDESQNTIPVQEKVELKINPGDVTSHVDFNDQPVQLLWKRVPTAIARDKILSLVQDTSISNDGQLLVEDLKQEKQLELVGKLSDYQRDLLSLGIVELHSSLPEDNYWLKQAMRDSDFTNDWPLFDHQDIRDIQALYLSRFVFVTEEMNALLQSYVTDNI